jgi:hypothetical protein
MCCCLSKANMEWVDCACATPHQSSKIATNQPPKATNLLVTKLIYVRLTERRSLTECRHDNRQP